jgi:hypothetical protein
MRIAEGGNRLKQFRDVLAERARSRMTAKAATPTKRATHVARA